MYTYKKAKKASTSTSTHKKVSLNSVAIYLGNGFCWMDLLIHKYFIRFSRNHLKPFSISELSEVNKQINCNIRYDR